MKYYPLLFLIVSMYTTYVIKEIMGGEYYQSVRVRKSISILITFVIQIELSVRKKQIINNFFLL